MNIFELIEPINLSNQVKTDNLAKQKRALSVSITRRRPAYSFMSSRMSTKHYNDNFVKMAVSPQTRKNSNGPVNKSLASRTRFEIMVPDLNKLTTETDRYKFVMSASREVLDKIEPGMYFGLRFGPVYKPIDQQLIYDFDSNSIYRRENVIGYENTVVYDPRNVYMMLDKNNYRNVFVDTKTYVPILHSQLTRLSDTETYADEIITDDIVPQGFFTEPHNAYDYREAARQREYYKQFNQHVQDLQDVYDAVENERLPADEDEALDDELSPPPPRKGRSYKPTQPTQPTQPAPPEQPAQPGMPKSVVENYIKLQAQRKQKEQEEQYEQDEQDDFIPYDDDISFGMKIANKPNIHDYVVQRIIDNMYKMYDFIVRGKEKNGISTNIEQEIQYTYELYKEKRKEKAKDSLKSFVIFLSHNTNPKVSEFGKKTKEIMEEYNYNIEFTTFLQKFLNSKIKNGSI